MCDPVTALIGAGTVLKAGGSIIGGRAAKKAANAQADSVRAEAKQQAKKIRDLATQTRSEATADYAASGVDVGSGSAVLAEHEITRRSELDALNTILGGERQAAALRKQGKAAQTAGYLDAAGSVLGGAADIYTGWKK